MTAPPRFPAFDAGRILFEDSAILVVDKPVGIPTQSADEQRPDDLVFRLRQFLAARDGQEGYLGTHQRLDRETSGLLVLTRSKAANGPLAQQFEGRAVEKKYVAGVEGFPENLDRTTLRDALARGDDGRMVVVSPSAKHGQKAVSHVKLGRRNEGRALVQVRLETGRTHQARVQLAHMGAPIAGDPLYGRVKASRLLLHASELRFQHPLTGQPLRFEAPVPPEFDDWLQHGDRGAGIFDDDEALFRALERARDRRFGLGHGGNGPRATTAFRLVNEGGDALPGLAVDVYGEFLVAQFYDDEATVWAESPRRERVLDALHRLGFKGIYVKYRPKQANVIVDSRKEEFAPRGPLRGEAAPEEFVILEEGVPYRVRLGDGLSTGIFLDQRENRRRVREMSAGRSVLNLFSYTCGFSVAAAVGGAWRTVSVDASVNCLERGRGNLEEAQCLDRADHQFVAEDAFAWLAKAAKRGERFDLVILDPPSYSTTKSRRFSAESDYSELAEAALGVLAKGGRLLASSNHRGIRQAKFRKALRDAADRAGRAVAQLKDMPEPLDYPPPLGGHCHLKCALLTLER